MPVRNGKNIVSLQFIAEDGDKRFLSGGKITGGFLALANHTDNKDVILICEGYATGMTLHDITKYPVAVAFNAKNLIPVAKIIKSQHPKSKIVICADNDSATKKPNGDPWNVGIEAGQQAAAAIGGAVVLYPQFADGEVGTDFNDLFILKGEPAISEIFAVFAPKIDDDIPELPPIEAYNKEELQVLALFPMKDKVSTGWRTELDHSDKGKTLKTLNNTTLFLENDEVLSNLFCYDEFCDEKVVYRCPPWETDTANFKVRTLTEEDKTSLTIELEKRGVAQSFQVVDRLLSSIIRKNSRDPAKEFFNSLQWDGVKRLDTWLRDYCKCTYDDERYVSAIGRKWLVAAVTRIFKPGEKFEQMLVLEGKTDAGKSLVLQELATFRNRKYFLDSLRVSDLGSRDAKMRMRGKVIIEFAELSGMGKTDSGILKQVIGSQVDDYVPKYSNESILLPRRFVLAGSYNPDGNGIFTDVTGNRRFWVVRTGDVLDIKGIREIKEQLWAEAVVYYKQGEKLYLEGELKELATIAQSERMMESPWELDIRPFVFEKNKVFTEDIWEKLGITDRSRRTRMASVEISKIMTKLGFIPIRARLGGTPKPAWERKEPIHLTRYSPEQELEF